MISSKNEFSKSLAVEYFSFCQSLNITDDLSIRNMVLILLKRSIIDTRNIPEEWDSILNDLTYQGIAEFRNWRYRSLVQTYNKQVMGYSL
jgi:hypothetical protein